MNGFWGMDPDQVRGHGDRSGDAAGRLADLSDSLRSAVEAATWVGPDADAFRDTFHGTTAPSIQDICDRLAAQGHDLQGEADQQDEASGDGDGGPPGFPGLPDLPDFPGLPGFPDFPGLPDIPFPDLPVPEITWPDVGWPDLELPDWLGDRLEAGRTAADQLGRDIGHAADVWGDLLSGERVPTIAELVSSSALPFASTLGLGANLITGEDQQFFSDRPGAEIGADQVHHQAGGTTPHSTVDLLNQVDEISVPQGSEHGNVRVQQVEGPDGQTRYIVYTPGTEANLSPFSDGWGQQGNSRDWAANVRAMAGQETAAMQNVRDAMAAAGVPPGADVMMVGHSQGGIINSHLASDPSFNGPGGYNVTNVVSAGSPAESASMPSSTHALNIQHGFDASTTRGPLGIPVPSTIAGDPVPTLDFGGYRADGSYNQQGNYQEVTLPGNHAPVTDPGGWLRQNHSGGEYTTSIAHDVQNNPDSAIAAYENSPGMQDYIGPGTRVTSTTDVEVGR